MPRRCMRPGQNAFATPRAIASSVGCEPGARRSIAMASPALRIWCGPAMRGRMGSATEPSFEVQRKLSPSISIVQPFPSGNSVAPTEATLAAMMSRTPGG